MPFRNKMIVLFRHIIAISNVKGLLKQFYSMLCKANQVSRTWGLRLKYKARLIRVVVRQLKFDFRIHSCLLATSFGLLRGPRPSIRNWLPAQKWTQRHWDSCMPNYNHALHDTTSSHDVLHMTRLHYVIRYLCCSVPTITTMYNN